ncbi:hypothetical protein Scep_023101 [Stephania cephalantha]|uniref:Uncharacterized protein n=1 Tax=Stephania cephalantha TaxID=152367 RepID=A0AAP0EUW2_9MAGN
MDPKILNPSIDPTSGDASTNASVEFPNHRRVSFSDQPNESNHANTPLLLHPAYARSKSLIYDELRNFRISLRWCALDHSSCTGKLVSYLTFIVLTIVVPIFSSLVTHAPKHTGSAPSTSISFNKLVQLPESALAAIAFFTLSGFFQQYGLRQLLFLDGLGDDSAYVRRGYTRELDKAFKHLAYILLPSFFVDFAHKILFFSTVTVTIPCIGYRIPSNSILFMAVLASWVYRTWVFLLVCVLFRLTCELQLLRFEGFKKLFEGCGSDPGVIFMEHMRIRKQLSVTSHRYRFFIIMSLVTITVSQLGALILVFTSKSEKNFFNSGDLVVCAAVELSGFFLCLLGAARITHRAQGVVAVATRWHMLVTSASSNPGFDTNTVKDLMPVSLHDVNNTQEGTTTTTTTQHVSVTVVAPEDASTFQTRQGLVTYLQHNNGGITLFGFTLDRGLLHTLFAFEFSLVLWILSKVVVLS